MLLVQDNLQGLKNFVIAIVSFLIIGVYLDLNHKGFFSKKQKNKYKTLKKINELNISLNKLQNLYSDDILTEKEFNEKSSSIKNELKNYKIDLKLSENEKYYLIKQSYEEDLITEEEFNFKIAQLRDEISLND